MHRPCPRRGIIAQAIEFVKSWSPDDTKHGRDVLPTVGLNAVLENCQHQPLTWREVAVFRERLRTTLTPTQIQQVLDALTLSLCRQPVRDVEQ